MSLIGKKLPAFTLLELIAVLILSGIITLMAYHVLGITRSYYHKFQQKEKAISTISQLAMIIDRDFRKAKAIAGDESNIIFDFQTHQVAYRFMSSYIVRNQSNVRDTFHLAVHDIALKRIDRENNKNNPIGELQLVVGGRDSVFFHFNKNYDAAALFRLQLKNKTKWGE